MQMLLVGIFTFCINILFLLFVDERSRIGRYRTRTLAVTECFVRAVGFVLAARRRDGGNERKNHFNCTHVDNYYHNNCLS